MLADEVKVGEELGGDGARDVADELEVVGWRRGKHAVETEEESQTEGKDDPL